MSRTRIMWLIQKEISETLQMIAFKNEMGDGWGQKLAYYEAKLAKLSMELEDFVMAS